MDNNERFIKARAIKNKIEYINRHLKLIDKNGWGININYALAVNNINSAYMFDNTFYYRKNDVITRNMHIKGMQAFLNSLKNDLEIEFKKL